MEEAALELEHGRVVRPWLDLIDHLRSLGVGSDLPLPQIAVMGDQSCGKSSVLEAISGIPFPRGSGLVTRVATQLTMKNAPDGCEWEGMARTNSKGHHQQPKNNETMTLKSPDEVASAISQLQDKLTKNRHSFSLDHIEIFVRGPGLPDLTLIDLPGIVRTRIAGQRASVVQDVNNLIEDFLVQERTIILAVVPANQDVATIDILERAKRVDPEGKRTIGVVTKPDLVDSGGENEVIAVVKNIRKPLKLGYVVVKCRSQADIDSGLDMKDAAAAEQSFFRLNSSFASLPPDVMGVSNLTQRLTNLLVSHIEQALPTIKWELQSQLTQTDKELKPMLKGVPLNTAECHASLMRMVSDYCRLLRESTRGFYKDELLSSQPKLRLHSNIQVVFRKLNSSIASTLPNFDDPAFVDELSLEIQSLKGKELPGFLNLQVFYSFIVKNVELWRPAVEETRTSITNLTLEMTSLLIDSLAVQYPKLCSSVREVLSRLLEELSEDVSIRMDDLLAKESDPFTTNDAMLDVMNTIRFTQFDTAIDEALKSAGDKPQGPEKLFESVESSLRDWYMRSHGADSIVAVNDMCTLLQAYWHVATKRLVDNVCMTMEQDFFSRLVSHTEEELFLISSRVKSLDELFIEDASVVQKRRALQAKRNRLQDGLQKMNEKAAHIIAEKPRYDECIIMCFETHASYHPLFIIVTYHSSQWEDVEYEGSLHKDGSSIHGLESLDGGNGTTSISNSRSSPSGITTSGVGGEMWKQKSSLVGTMGTSKQISDLVESAGRRVKNVGTVRGSENDSSRVGGASPMPSYQQKHHHPGEGASHGHIASFVKVKL